MLCILPWVSNAQKTVDPLVSRIAADQVRARARARRLREEDVPRLAGELRARGARRVRLFGSLATQAEPHAATDIDLAVDGMEEGAAAEALLALELTVDARIDLVLWETAGERVRRAIERDGVEVNDVTR